MSEPTKPPRDEHDQPLPTPNDHPAMQDLVMEDIAARKQVGIGRYGTVLQPFNGRDMMRDAYEEALDLCVYLRGLIYERDHGADEVLAKDVQSAKAHAAQEHGEAIKSYVEVWTLGRSMLSHRELDHLRVALIKEFGICDLRIIVSPAPGRSSGRPYSMVVRYRAYYLGEDYEVRVGETP